MSHWKRPFRATKRNTYVIPLRRASARLERIGIWMAKDDRDFLFSERFVQLQDLRKTQHRAAKVVVQHYMKRHWSVPPLIVKVCGKYIIRNGHHRVTAAIKRGAEKSMGKRLDSRFRISGTAIRTNL